VEEKVVASEKARTARANAEVHRLVDAELPRILARLEGEDRRTYRADAETAELAKIIEELKTKENQ
jgi:hypothetical protein